MLVLLGALSAFNLIAGAGASGAAVRLLTAEGREAFSSAALYRIAAALAWSFPVVALAATAGAWGAYNEARDGLAAALIAAPVAWLLLGGIVFAVVDVAEDGVLDFGRGRGAGEGRSHGGG